MTYQKVLMYISEVLYFTLLLQTFDYLSILWLLNIEMILIYFLNKKIFILSPFSVHTPLPSTFPPPSIHPQFLSRKGQISHDTSSCSKNKDLPIY